MTFAEFIDTAAKMQEEIIRIAQDLENKKNEYRAFTKQHFGLADGDQMNVLDVAKAVRKVSELG